MSITGHDPGHDGVRTYDTASLEYLKRLIDTVPDGPRGMRWIHQPDGVLCHVESELDPPYDDFVARVDIATVSRRFDGVRGSVTEVLRRHPGGRATLQVERVTVGPSRMGGRSLLGGTDVDLHWLERIDYGPDEQRIWIRTIHDRSTVHYDGYVAFARVAGRTRIAFLACRRFPLPRALTLVRLDRWRWLTRVLAESLLRRFFQVTTANIMASYHGRDVAARPLSGERGSWS